MKTDSRSILLVTVIIVFLLIICVCDNFFYKKKTIENFDNTSYTKFDETVITNSFYNQKIRVI